MELQRKAMEPLSPEQQERRAQAAARKAQGAALLEEGLDAVKRMSQLATDAKCAAVRCSLCSLKDVAVDVGAVHAVLGKTGWWASHNW